MDWESFIRALNEASYQGPLAVEWKDHGMNRDHGRIIPVSGAKATSKFDRAALQKARKPIGEWNTTEATIQDGNILAKVNGSAVDTGKCDLTEGQIGFQSEGAAIEFKNIRIKEMK